MNWVFPNWHYQVSAGRFWTHEFWPLAQNRSLWEGRFYQPQPKTVRERIQLEFVTSQIADGMLEDLSNIESTQRGMNSGAKPFLQLQDGEVLIRHSLAMVQRWIRSKSVVDAIA